MLRGVVFVSIAAVCALGGCSPSPQGDPDPGQRMLHSLAPVLSAIPAKATVAYRHLNAPRWDSCDGKASTTYGWDDISVDYRFASRGPDAVVFQTINHRLTDQGWHLVSVGSSVPAGGGSWTRVLPNRETARATLNGPGDGAGRWSLYAGAQPAVQPVSGC